MKQVIIEVLGGVVQDVCVDEGVRVVVIDWDNFEGNVKDCTAVYTASGTSDTPNDQGELSPEA